MRLLLQESHAPCVVPHNKNAHHVHFVRATHDRLSGLFADKCVAAYMPPPDYDTVDVQMADQRAVTPEGSMATESVFDGYDTNPYGSSRKRRRLMEDPQVQAENMHQLWAEELLDYFMLQGEADAPSTLPLPPEGANLDRAIDDKGHTALHWAVAMGDLEIVKRLLTDRASIDVQSKSGETPLMRSVLLLIFSRSRTWSALHHSWFARSTCRIGPGLQCSITSPTLPSAGKSTHVLGTTWIVS